MAHWVGAPIRIKHLHRLVSNSGAQLLIERVVIADGGLEIIWRDQGWQELAGELAPGSIGAESQEWEQQEETA
ncbi:MAG: hypothetical protein AMXMBFR52_26460 [Burkholderiales bacterium]